MKNKKPVLTKVINKEGKQLLVLTKFEAKTDSIWKSGILKRSSSKK